MVCLIRVNTFTGLKLKNEDRPDTRSIEHTKKSKHKSVNKWRAPGPGRISNAKINEESLGKQLVNLKQVRSTHNLLIDFLLTILYILYLDQYR